MDICFQNLDSDEEMEEEQENGNDKENQLDTNDRKARTSFKSKKGWESGFYLSKGQKWIPFVDLYQWHLYKHTNNWNWNIHLNIFFLSSKEEENGIKKNPLKLDRKI